MRKIRQNNRVIFIVVYEFMMNDLALAGIPLLLYARIFGFCANGCEFYESKAKTAKLLGTTVRSVFRARSVLIDRRLIVERASRSKTDSRECSIDLERLPSHVRANLDAYGWDTYDISTYDKTTYDDAAPDKPSPYDNLSPPHMTSCHPIRKKDNKDFDMKGGP